jgi:rhodanese-related sulfurtransferase
VAARAAHERRAVGEHHARAIELINREDALLLDVRDAGEYARGTSSARSTCRSRASTRARAIWRRRRSGR